MAAADDLGLSRVRAADDGLILVAVPPGATYTTLAAFDARVAELTGVTVESNADDVLDNRAYDGTYDAVEEL